MLRRKYVSEGSGFQREEHSADSQAFSVFARSEAVYDMHFVPLRVVFLHQGSWEGPLGAMFLVLGCT